MRSRGSTAASAVVRCALAPNLSLSAPTAWLGLPHARCGPRGRGPLRPRRAHSPFRLNRSGGAPAALSFRPPAPGLVFAHGAAGKFLCGVMGLVRQHALFGGGTAAAFLPADFLEARAFGLVAG